MPHGATGEEKIVFSWLIILLGGDKDCFSIDIKPYILKIYNYIALKLDVSTLLIKGCEFWFSALQESCTCLAGVTSTSLLSERTSHLDKAVLQSVGEKFIMVLTKCRHRVCWEVFLLFINLYSFGSRRACINYHVIFYHNNLEKAFSIRIKKKSS